MYLQEILPQILLVPNIFQATHYNITGNLNSLDVTSFKITCEENTNNTKLGSFFNTNVSTTQLVNNGDSITIQLKATLHQHRILIGRLQLLAMEILLFKEILSQ